MARSIDDPTENIYASIFSMRGVCSIYFLQVCIYFKLLCDGISHSPFIVLHLLNINLPLAYVQQSSSIVIEYYIKILNALLVTVDSIFFCTSFILANVHVI